MPDVLPLDLDGKVVVIRGEADPDDEDRLAAELFANGAALVVRLGPGESVETLDEEQMRAAGWIRVLSPRSAHHGHRIDTFRRGDGVALSQCIDCDIRVDPVCCG